MLTRKSKYGIKAMLLLAEEAERGPILISDLAERQRLPKKFLEAILLELKPKHRIAFVLHAIEEFDVQSVATMTNESIAATYKNITRARKQIEARAEQNPLLRKFLDHRGRQP